MLRHNEGSCPVCMERSSILLAMCSILFCAPSAYSSTDKSGQGILLPGQVISDEDLVNLAVRKHMIPEVTDEAYFDKQVKEKNTVNVWILMSHDEKLKVIPGLKEQYSKQGITIKLDDSYYVDEMNGVLYSSIFRGEMSFISGKGLGHIFKTIAVMEGDFDNGEDKVEVARQELGSANFELFKSIYPEKYDKLIKKR
jgi:hypothetical protein